MRHVCFACSPPPPHLFSAASLLLPLGNPCPSLIPALLSQLQKGESASVCAGMRFFVVSRVATTAIEVLPAAASAEGSTGNLPAIATPDGIRRGQSVAGQGMKEGGLGVGMGLDSRGRAGGGSAESRAEGMDVEEGSGGQGVEVGSRQGVDVDWAAVGLASAGARGKLVEEEARAAKRARGEAPIATTATAATAGATNATGAGATAAADRGQQASSSAGSGSASSPVAPGVFDAPFGLLQVRWGFLEGRRGMGWGRRS